MPLLHLEPLPPRVRKGDVLEFVESVGGLDRRRIGRIELGAKSATIEVPEGWQTRLVRALDGQALAGRRLRAWAAESAGPSTGEDHFQRLARLLTLESEAEAHEAARRSRQLGPEEAERGGTALANLEIVDEDTGLGGRYLVQLSKRGRPPLPWTRLDVGSPVVLSPQGVKNPEGYRGVVYQRWEDSIRVALAAELDSDLRDQRWRLDLSSDQVALERQQAALERARTARGERLAEMRDVFLGLRQPEFAAGVELAQGSARLDPTQQEAVRFALCAKHLALIHGPPGTGKTTTVAALIAEATARGSKVLATAPSNLAVDNLLEGLLSRGVRAVRLGHPARVLQSLREHTLDLLVEEHADVRLARKLVKEALALFRRAQRFTRARPAPGERQEIRQEARALLADARRLEQQAAEQILDQADVLCATTTGLDSTILGTRTFDLAVVDEACQSVEPGSWIPILRCDRVVLAGDHCQLPPTIISPEAEAGGLGISLFERLIALHGPPIARRLEVQYRMHEAIMGFSSAEFYDGALAADASVKSHLLADLPGVAASPETSEPLAWIDTAGAGYDEEVEPDGESRRNPEEARLVIHKVRQLIEGGVDPEAIAVITPYAAQVRLLREGLPVRGLEIDSVDGFQGREKEAVVISLVRSNERGEIGFLGDVRRMNVALTRARRRLVVVGDSATLAGHDFYARLLEYFEQHGAYHTVWEENLG